MRFSATGRFGSILAFAFILIVTWAVYAPGLQGSFLFDDHPNIVDNEQLHIDRLDWPHLKQAVFSLNAGPLKRPISMLTLTLNYYASGLNPYWYKVTNLVIHLCAGLAVLWLSRLLLRAFALRDERLAQRDLAPLATLIAAAWLVHPINLTGVLYIVQRMTSLAALFSFLCMAFYTWGRLRQLQNAKGVWIILTGVLVLMPLGAFSKENALLLPFFLFVIEIACFSFAAPTRATRRWIAYAHVFLVCLPAVAIAAYLFSHIDWVRSMYVLRPFTLEQRLLTEPRVIWLYLQLILLPVASRFGIYHDDIALSTSFVTPITTLAAIGGIAALAALAAWSYKRHRWLFFGIAFFFVGHSLESTVFSLEIAHEHRNYLPSYGILFSLISGITLLAVNTRLHRYRFVFPALFICVFAAVTAIRSPTWSNNLTHAVIEVKNHPDSARAHLELGRQYRILLIAQDGKNAGYFAAAERNFRAAQRLDPNNLTGLFSLVALYSAADKPLDGKWLDTLYHRLSAVPLDLPTPALLVNLASCQESGYCRLPRSIIDSLFQAILANRTLTGSARSKVLAQAAQMSVNEGHLPEALAYSKAAVENAPNEPQHLLNLLAIQLDMRRYADATDTYNILNNMDLTPYYSEKLHHYRVPRNPSR